MLATIVLLAVIWAPSWVILPRDEGLEAAWRIWIAQVIVASALIFLADKIGLLNPAEQHRSGASIRRRAIATRVHSPPLSEAIGRCGFCVSASGPKPIT